MALIGMLNIGTQLLTKGLESGARRAQSVLGGLRGSINGVGGSLMGLAGAGGVGLFVRRGIQLAATAEQNQIALETMLGSAEKAHMVLAELTSFAANTPFKLPELTDAAKQLSGFGYEAQEIVPFIKQLGDVSAGLNVPIGELAYVFGTARTQGRLFAKDIYQLTARGIPIVRELAKQFGVADDKVMKLVEDGKVGFKDVEIALRNMTATGSKFGGLMEKQAETLAGQWEKLGDTIDQLAASFAKAALESLKVKEQMPGLIGGPGDQGVDTPGTIELGMGFLGSYASSGWNGWKSFATFLSAGLMPEGEAKAAMHEQSRQQMADAMIARGRAELMGDNLTGAREDSREQLDRMLRANQEQVKWAKKQAEEAVKTRTAIEKLPQKIEMPPFYLGPAI